MELYYKDKRIECEITKYSWGKDFIELSILPYDDTLYRIFQNNDTLFLDNDKNRGFIIKNLFDLLDGLHIILCETLPSLSKT